MLRMRLVLLVVVCVLGLSIGCQSMCDRPLLSRWFGSSDSDCCNGCCTDGCCSSPTVIYDGPVLPEGAPMMAPVPGGGPMMAPVPGGAPLPAPTPIPAPPSGTNGGRIVPQPQVRSQPIPYVPMR